MIFYLEIWSTHFALLSNEKCWRNFATKRIASLPKNIFHICGFFLNVLKHKTTTNEGLFYISWFSSHQLTSIEWNTTVLLPWVDICSFVMFSSKLRQFMLSNRIGQSDSKSDHPIQNLTTKSNNKICPIQNPMSKSDSD